MKKNFEVPVAFIVFKRLDTMKEVFKSIRAIEPNKLYVISDAAREGNDTEEEKVKNVRSYIEQHVDWPCEVIKVYADKNMGCKNRIVSGLDYVFSKENKAIILEDDCVPSQEFFDFCSELLDYYENDERIMMISGCNPIQEYPMEYSYTFSLLSSIWGWATWSRAWQKYDGNISSWKDVEKKGLIKNLYETYTYSYLKENFNLVYEHKNDTWDYQWEYARIINSGLGIVPKQNMIKNIGFGEDATHTIGNTPKNINFSWNNIKEIIAHPPYVMRDWFYDKAYQDKFMKKSRVKRVIKKIICYEKLKKVIYTFVGRR